MKRVFERGRTYRLGSLTLQFKEDSCLSFLAFGVSVSKKNCSRAVDRNRIKRHLRCAVKEIEKETFFTGYCVLIYKGKKLPDRDLLNLQIFRLLKKVKG